MIRLRRRPKTPKTLKSAKVTDARGAVRLAIKQRKKPEFKSYWLEEDVRGVLWENQWRKCCYCERKREAKREPDIDHFRPKGRIIIGEKKHCGYWWLAYAWNNLYFSCKPCNQIKKDEFPLLDEAMRARSPADDLSKERPVLIDPGSDNPEEFIDFQWIFDPIPLAKPVPAFGDENGRGRESIRLLGLDRPDLNEERGHELLLLRALAAKMNAAQELGRAKVIARAKANIQVATRANQPFAGFRRAFFRKVGLAEFVAQD